MNDKNTFYYFDGNCSFFRKWLVCQTYGGTRVSRGFDVLDMPNNRYRLCDREGQAEFIRDFDAAMADGRRLRLATVYPGWQPLGSQNAHRPRFW